MVYKSGTQIELERVEHIKEFSMSKIVLIGKNESFLQQCAAKLRWLNHKAFIHRDVMDGLRELLLFRLDCIVWDVETNDPYKIRKYKAIKRYHRDIPLIVIDDNKETYRDEDLDYETFIMTNNPNADDVVHQIIDTIQISYVLPDDERLERLEKKYGLVD